MQRSRQWSMDLMYCCSPTGLLVRAAGTDAWSPDIFGPEVPWSDQTWLGSCLVLLGVDARAQYADAQCCCA